ncbi:unnamed protein product [Lactuca saligna]|uniref:Uncharacterized protein n=1 Tax=Lactuca saligna TaxID=75948 RepID=A0AA35YL62_LACSI|nr:unnamed protein product [Lactuca saligna]
MSKRRMRELVGLFLVEWGNAGSSGPASPSQPTSMAVSLDILGGQFAMPGQREVVVPSCPGGSFQREKPYLINEAGTLSHSLSFKAYAPGWISTLMVAAIDCIRLAGASQGQLKVLQGALVGMWEEVCDSEAEHQVRMEQNDIMACKKAALEDQVATLEDRSE